MPCNNQYNHDFSSSSKRLLAGLLAGGFLTGFAPLCWSMEPTLATTQTGLSLQGFGTLGLTRTNDDQAQYVRDLSQPTGADTRWTPKVDSLLGLQANYSFNPRTEAVAQVVTRYHANDSYQPELTWAFLRHDLTPDVSLRAGRLGTEFFMLGDSRLIGYANPSVRPPPDFYGSLVFSYVDGADVSATLPVADGLLKGKLFVGKSPERAPFAPAIQWDLRRSRLMGTHLDYLHGPWQLRLSHAQVRFKQEAPTDLLLQNIGNPLAGMPYLALVPAMAMANTRARFSSAGLVFDEGPLNIQLMFNQIRYDSPAYADSRAAYMMTAYRVGTLAPYLGLSRSLATMGTLPESPVPGVDGITHSLVAQSFTDQTTTTLGMRWDWRKNFALKAQIDWMHGKPASLFLLKQAQPGWDGHLTVFSLALDFVF